MPVSDYFLYQIRTNFTAENSTNPIMATYNFYTPIFISLIGCLGNSVTFLTIVLTELRKNYVNSYVSVLLISDSLVLLKISTERIFTWGAWSYWFCVGGQYFWNLPIYISNLTVVLLTLERFFAIIMPFTHMKEKIRRSIYQKYRNQTPLNLVELIKEIGDQLRDGPEKIDFSPSVSQMRLLLKGIGFRYEKIRGRPQIFESRELGEKRQKYLRKIQKLRDSGTEIIWMDETWVWAGMKKEYEWIDQNVKRDPFMAYREHHTTGPKPSVLHGSRAIVVGAMSQNEIITESCKIFRGGRMEDGDYHRQMDSTIFEQWLRENIPRFISTAKGHKVVIIMDNAPYHSRRLTKIPTKSSSKKEMILFLENCGVQNIPFGLKKDEFYAFLMQFMAKKSQFHEKLAVETICEEFGIEYADFGRWRVILLMLVITFLFNANILFAIDDKDREFTNPWLCKYNYKLKFAHWFFLVPRLLFTFLIPLITVLLINIAISIKLRTRPKIQSNLRKTSDDSSRNAVLWFIPLCYVLLNCPYNVLTTYKSFWGIDRKQNIWDLISIYIFTINYAVNCIFYAMASRNFRQEFQNLWLKRSKTRRSVIKGGNSSSNNSGSNKTQETST